MIPTDEPHMVELELIIEEAPATPHHNEDHA